MYSACEIRTTFSKVAPKISYSGPTYIAIRSSKHSSSTAYSHGRDFDHVLKLEEFRSIVKNEGEVKPAAMTFSDGGPDENARFPKTLDVVAQHFKKHKFDALLISTHAPGLSAYNQVVKRMALLSKALAGFLLPYDTFGNHLDSQGRAIEVKLEKRNFKKAGEVLGEVWNELLIDKFSMVCHYLENSTMEPAPCEESWVSKHCRILQYFFSPLYALMTNAVVHSVQTGSEYFQIDFFLLQFSSDKILQAQLFHRLAKSKQLIDMLIYGNALL